MEEFNVNHPNRILVVSSTDLLARQTRLYLDDRFPILPLYDHNEIEETLERDTPFLVILDEELEGGASGLQVWRKYLSRPLIKEREIPYLALCSIKYDYPDYTKEAESLGSVGILPKPIERKNLTGLLNRLLVKRSKESNRLAA